GSCSARWPAWTARTCWRASSSAAQRRGRSETEPGNPAQARLKDPTRRTGRPEPARAYIRPPSIQAGLMAPATIIQLATVLAGLAAWELAARSAWVDPLFIPAPSAVARALAAISGPALAGLADTLAKTAAAYVLSVVLGVSAGVAVGSVRLLRDVLSPYVIALYGMPKILVLPWIVLLLGYGTAPAVFYGTLHGLFPILVLGTGAVRDV